MGQSSCLRILAATAVLVAAVSCSRTAQTPAPAATEQPSASQPAAAQPGATQPAAGQPSTAQPQGAPTATPARPPAGTPAPAAAPAGVAAPASQAAPVPPAPPKLRTFTLEAGTVLEVQTVSSLSTKTNKAGEPIAATLVAPLVDGDWVIATKGAPVSGVIVAMDPGGRVKGVATMSIAMNKLNLADGEAVAITTSSYDVEAKSSTKKDIAKVAVGAGAGAIIGGIAGGGKGAAIGAGVGGGAGTAGVLATRGDPAVIPAGTVVSVKLTEPVTVTKKQ